MARANTAKHFEYLLEIDTAGDGTFATVCGLTDVTINRTSNMDTTEVPDCDDPSLPLALERAVRSQEVSLSASGVWALGASKMVSDWWYSGLTKPVRMRNLKVEAEGATGDISAETGPAYLVTLNNSVTVGQKVTAELEIQFDGVPTTTLVAAA